jgi:hypothetical protein
MLRRIALTVVPCVAVYTAAVCLASSLTPRADRQVSHNSATTSPAQHLAARSGYIVASS